MHISIDLGDTLFNRTAPKIQTVRGEVYQIFPAAIGVLSGQKHFGDRISIISFITKGAEPRLMLNLIQMEVVPFIVAVEDVRFCYEKKDKGPIAYELGTNILIDDRILCLNSAHVSGIPHKILFTGAHDESLSEKISFGDLFIARNWIEVGEILRSLR